ncbi:DUF3810 domain-containing protein [Butyrivibrio sp. CB08]|uniref:DUF3810 domain-containing protein n=1 Tax=Butyrivibrio sp. CB08 TaxID=2364879 RepID=UPI000EA9D64C|nr:DUF3810 domain-containing protein [Butyrivibrio sp. CB08]RKM58880.1 DUF3810 domain-containing protein [Butyrivibrio sp. CB08]
MKKFSITGFLVGIMLGVSAALNVAAWISTGFSDLYTKKIFMVIMEKYGRLTSRAPFSVGEIMLIVCFLLVLALLAYLVLWLISGIRSAFGKRDSSFSKVFGKIMAVFLSFVVLLMTLNCFILYHCSQVAVAENHRDDYTVEELAALRDFLVTKCNKMAEEMPRDKKGNVVYEGDMKEMAKASMKNLEGSYDRLGGFYVTPKELTFSGFMSQQYMQGYYFPFSMEANINKEMYIMNKPFTMCHELSHTHGYIYEDEANFLGFLGCVKSEDEIFNYSGYLGVLAYVNNDFYKSVSEEEYKSHVAISKRVRYDSQFLTDEAWEEVEKRAILDTETVKKAADTFIDTNLKANGISSGKASYSHVVGLLLDYYSENPYN